jgi:hypothetical protein
MAAKTSTPRNVVTKLDDLGLYADMVRWHGETITNYRSRLMRAQTLKGGNDAQRLTDAVCNELGLGQTYLMLVTATLNQVELEVTEIALKVSFSGVLQKEIPLIVMDADGAWVAENISGMVSGLVGVSGISATWVSGLETLPAFLLEPQSSYVQVVNEQVPQIQSFSLGVLGHGEAPIGPVLSGTVTFNDDETFRTQVNGDPSADGEWSVTESGRVNVYTAPQDLLLASYKYNLLGSGLTMGLVGNGARLFNLASEDVQSLLFTASGIGQTAKEFLFDIRFQDRNFWGE